jgi:hypothetical protein
MTSADFIHLLTRLYQQDLKWPKPLHLLQGAVLLDAGLGADRNLPIGICFLVGGVYLSGSGE